MADNAGSSATAFLICSDTSLNPLFSVFESTCYNPLKSYASIIANTPFSLFHTLNIENFETFKRSVKIARRSLQIDGKKR